MVAGAQWLLHGAALFSPLMTSKSPLLAGALLIAAGIFQWTPLKNSCLTHCRSPLSFLMTDWREGNGGAFVMGVKHGAFCAGCCWFLMALLFVAGVMNVWWIAAITILVLLEKVVSRGLWVGRIAGVVFLGWGIWVLAAGRVRLKAGEGERVLAVFLDCGGKSDATPLSSARGGWLIAMAVVGAKAVSRPTCHRSP